MNKRPIFGHRGAANAGALPRDTHPQRHTFSALVVTVLLAHVALLWGMTGGLNWRLEQSDPMRVAPLQTRWIPPAALPAPGPTVAPPAKQRTRVATVPAAPASPVLAASAASQPDAPTESIETQNAPNPLPEVSKTTAPSSDIPTTPPTAETASSPDTALPAAPAPEVYPAASTDLPPIPLGALPPSVLLSYRLTGQEKGLNYHANGELRWQHNEATYALSLSVKAFLLGSRQWRSVGEITGSGLVPKRFSDSWRNERAAHFDRANQRVVFSNNAPAAQLGPGAQDQISLYVQLAAAMAGDPQRFESGTRLQVQTVTLRDALPWLLTLGPPETLQLNGQTVPTVKWLCQPRNRFDATVEFWVSAQHAWMPVRIRITQVSGSFIDLMLSGQEALPPLPAQTPPAAATAG